jgi:hypothetical protein
METKNCQNCKQDFIIDQDDFSFYKKMGVVPPHDCPPCRDQLRLTFRNERFFYKRACDNCKKDKISVFSPNKTFPVWCHECWWSDDLDAKKYGIDYDPTKSFFEQFNEILQKVPKPNIIGTRNINSEYVNLVADCKDCYMVVESSNNENCINCYWIQLSKDLVDCSFTNKVELSYDVDDCYDCHSLKFSKGCHSCLDSAFLLDCRGCTDCLGCINLREQKYNIFNKQYSKEEYEEKLKSYNLDTYTGLEAFKKEFQEFIKDKPRKFAELSNALNSTGSYMDNVKNNKHCFHSYEAEDNAYCTHVWRGAKNCMDSSTVGRTAELMYNTINTGQQASNVVSSFHCWGSQFMDYCFNCPNSNNCFGCVGIIKGSYCIFNKQYTKEEYQKIRKEIVDKMTKEGTYGNFFPKNFSPLGYNESSAIDEYPITKEEALAQGFAWEDTPRGTYGKETINWSNFPDSIKELPADFNVDKEIFVCTKCAKNYRLTHNELNFYRRMNIPIPRTCPECRHVERFNKRGPNKLWHRTCMCQQAEHSHAQNCPNEFETNYSPDRTEIIYCESCYNKEVY